VVDGIGNMFFFVFGGNDDGYGRQVSVVFGSRTSLKSPRGTNKAAASKL